MLNPRVDDYYDIAIPNRHAAIQVYDPLRVASILAAELHLKKWKTKIIGSNSNGYLTVRVFFI
jgi:hypothetical protein